MFSPSGEGGGEAVAPLPLSKAFCTYLLGPGAESLVSRVAWARPGRGGEREGRCSRVSLFSDPSSPLPEDGKVGKGPSTHLVSVGFVASLGGRTHTLPAARPWAVSQSGVIIMIKDLGYVLEISRAALPGGSVAPEGLGLCKFT